MAKVARICLIGPESTGKSRLARRFADEFRTVWVPEFAREYVERHGNELTADDVEPIARGEIATIDRLAPQAKRLLLLDTDLVSTVVYARHYYGACPPWIEEEARRRLADFYVLFDIDIAWKADPARDAGDPHVRERLFVAFRDALDEFGARYEIVSGPWDERAEALRRILTRCVS